jgi:hypothetical protein
MLIPNEALFKEGINYYVWVIRSRSGVLGVEYYTVKIKVFVLDSDANRTAVSRGQGIEYMEPVVVSFNKELTVNGRVGRVE